MNNQINIKHTGTSFGERKSYFFLLFLVIMFLFALIQWIQKGVDNMVWVMIITGIIAGISTALNIIQTRLYLVDFISDSNNISIRYFNGTKEYKYESSIDKIEVKLKNTTSRSGFNCELKVVIDRLKFTIDDKFDWSLTEMKMLFEYIQFHKGITLTETDRFNISKIEEKIKKNL